MKTGHIAFYMLGNPIFFIFIGFNGNPICIVMKAVLGHIENFFAFAGHAPTNQ
jgi:hypothetical protein